MQGASPETPMIDESQGPPTVHGDADTAPTGPTEPGEATAPVQPAEHIGKYEVVKLLGRGGMGAVYQAFDPVLEREVALKVMLPQIAEDPEQKQRFEREARAIARLTHSNVVMVFDLGYHTDGAPYIVMELLKGKDLLHLMHQEPGLSLSQKVSIVVQVLNGLGHAHKLGIVHRDIKPANVSITEDGSAKIMDFGIAHLASASAGATADGSVIGTAAYMSPEQARGERVDGRSDLFSVGSLLCELVTGRRPFEAETIMGTLYAIAQSEPQLRLSAGPEYDRLRSVLEKALRKDREERFATSADFAGALAACLDASGAVAAEPASSSPERAGASPAGASVGPNLTRTLGGVASVSPAPALPAVEVPPAVEAAPARPADPSKLFRLLREIYVGGKSGQLHFTAGRSCRGLRILKGQVIHGTSDVDGEHLGDVLVRYGVIAESDREKAVEIVLRERRQLGEVLVGQGLLDQTRLEEAIGLHVREILFTMLDGPDGSHSFEELSETAMGKGIACQLSTGEVILEATRRVQDPALVRQILGDTGRILALSSDPLLRSQKITLTPTDGFVMSRVDGTLSAREVLTLSPVPAEDTERSLFGLLCTGVIDYQEKHTTGRSRTNPPRTRPATKPPSPPAAAPSPVSTTNPAGPAAGSGPGNGTPPAVGQSTQDLRQLILEAHGRLTRDHFEVLGLSRSATDTDVRQAYSRFARVLHPDARRPPALAGEEEMREEVFLRVTAAYETLRDPELRRKYEIAYEPSKLRGPTTPAFTPTPQFTPTPEAEPEPTPPPPPMPAPPSPPPPAPEAEPAADRTPAPAAPAESKPSGFDPVATLRKAEAQFAEQAYWDVIQRVEPLLPQLDGPLRTRGVLLLARAYMKNPKWQKRAEEALLDLLQDDPECTPAYLFLGQIYAGQDLTSRARGMYRKVLELEPDHQAALGVLARLEAQAEEAPQGGTLQGWFKGRRPNGA